MINLLTVREALAFAQNYGFKKPQLRLTRAAFEELHTEFSLMYSSVTYVFPSWPYRNVEIYGMRVYIVDEQVGPAMITEEGESWIVFVNDNGVPTFLESAEVG